MESALSLRSLSLPQPRPLSLTAGHVARVHRPMADPGPPDGRTLMTDADFAAMRDGLLAARPASEAFHLFAYGSLIWKPACPVLEQRPAVLVGWHRRFCFRINRYRGCDDRPGLMLSLDRGGSCRGVLQRLAEDCALDSLDQVLRREFSYKPSAHRAAWVTVTAEGRRLPALAFIMDRASPLYEPDLSLEQQADRLAFACGHVGTCAEYLLNTVEHLEALGIHDRYLWRLQHLVAERIGHEGGQ